MKTAYGRVPSKGTLICRRTTHWAVPKCQEQPRAGRCAPIGKVHGWIAAFDCTPGGHGSKARAPLNIPIQVLKWVVHLPQNGISLALTHGQVGMQSDPDLHQPVSKSLSLRVMRHLVRKWKEDKSICSRSLEVDKRASKRFAPPIFPFGEVMLAKSGFSPNRK